MMIDMMKNSQVLWSFEGILVGGKINFFHTSLSIFTGCSISTTPDALFQPRCISQKLAVLTREVFFKDVFSALCSCGWTWIRLRWSAFTALLVARAAGNWRQQTKVFSARNCAPALLQLHSTHLTIFKLQILDPESQIQDSRLRFSHQLLLDICSSTHLTTLK